MSAGLTVPRLFNVHCFAAAFESVEGARERVASGITDKVMHDSRTTVRAQHVAHRRRNEIHPSTISPFNPPLLFSSLSPSCISRKRDGQTDFRDFFVLDLCRLSSLLSVGVKWWVGRAVRRIIWRKICCNSLSLSLFGRRGLRRN